MADNQANQSPQEVRDKEKRLYLETKERGHCVHRKVYDGGDRKPGKELILFSLNDKR